MAWRIEFATGARKALKDLDPTIVRRILKFLSERIAPAEDPRAIGEDLKGSKLGDFWKYRVGDYRHLGLDITKLRALGFEPAVSLAEGLDHFVRGLDGARMTGVLGRL